MATALDLKGKKFGHLEVLYWVGHNLQGKNVWHCRCDCKDKTEVDVTVGALMQGAVQSCGCSRKKPHKDLTGQTINGFKVLEYVGKSKWKCICPNCGRETEKRHNDLLSGYAKTCGKCTPKPPDIKGQIFGHLEALEVVKEDKSTAFWKFKCHNCGNDNFIALDKDVYKGKLTHCGCLHGG